MIKYMCFLMFVLVPATSMALTPTPQDMNFEQCTYPGEALPSWSTAGNQGYNTQCAPVGTGAAQWSALISSASGHGQFGAIVQCMDAANFHGNIVFTGALATANVVNGYAGLWLRADAADGTVVAFDNMASRGVMGTTNFQNYQILLNIPQSAVRICFGSLLTGDGQVWAADLSLDSY